MATIKRTLGGERVGSENKMKVKLHGFNRSTHNIGRVFGTDQAVGTIVPCFVDFATDGTDYYIDMQEIIRTLPTDGPVFGSFKFQIDAYKIPIRLYNAMLHNNMLGIGLNMSRVKLPMARWIVQPIEPGRNDQQIAPDSLTAYLGTRGFGRTENEASTTRDMQIMLELMYWEIYKNYYANKQEEIGAVVATTEDQIDGELIKIEFQDNGTTIQTLEPPFYNEHQGAWQEEQVNGIKFTFTKKIEDRKFDGWPFRIVVGQNNNTSKSESISEFAWMAGYDDTAEWVGNTKTITRTSSNNRIIILSENTHISQRKEESQAETELKIATFPLSNIDEMREYILQAPTTKPFVINVDKELKLPYAATLGRTETENPKQSLGNGCFWSQSGLGLKTYLSDRFNNWLSTEWIEGNNGINELTAVKPNEDGTISMDELILKKKLFYMMNRIAVSGGSWNDWREVVYGQRIVRLPESPVYEGGMSAEIIFQEVVSSSDSVANGQSVPLGSLGGRGTTAKQKGGKLHIHIDEPSVVMIVESITPRICYSQGNKWYTALETLDDLHKPNLDGIGFQDLITEEMAAFDTIVNEDGTVQKFSAGKQPSWIQYQTNQDESYGDFSAEKPLDFMMLNRRYSANEDGSIKDLTTYIDPTIYNKAFAVEDIKAKNFWVHINIDCKVRRVMAANQIPNL